MIFFLSIVGDSSNEREIRMFEEGLNSKVKLLLYKAFNKVVEFKSTCMGKVMQGLDYSLSSGQPRMG